MLNKILDVILFGSRFSDGTAQAVLVLLAIVGFFLAWVYVWFFV